MEENINNISDTGEQSQAQETSQETSVEAKQEQSNQQQNVQEHPALSQAQINKMAQEALANDPRFQRLEKLEEIFNPKQDQQNPFDAELGLGNVTDAAQYLNQNLTAQQQEIQALKEEAAYLKNREAIRDYESAMNTFTTYWEDKYSDEDSFNNAVTQAIKADKNLSEAFEQAQANGGGLDANFIANLNQTMVNLWVSKLDDPSSGALDALLKQAAQKKALQDQSMLSSNNQTTDSGKTHDKFSSRLVIYDE